MPLKKIIGFGKKYIYQGEDAISKGVTDRIALFEINVGFKRGH